MVKKRYFFGILIMFILISGVGIIGLHHTFINNIYTANCTLSKVSDYNLKSNFWYKSGNPICRAVENQTNIQIVISGEGAIIVWQDNRSGNWDIYAQRIYSNGFIQTANWETNGIVICNASNNQTNPQLIPDGSGGAIIVWQDDRIGITESDIYAQRINETGNIEWIPNGIVICNASDYQKNPQIVSNSSGGAIIAWCDNRSNSEDIYVQYIDANGQTQWLSNGTVICNSSGNQNNIKICTDGNGGAIIVWEDLRGGNKDIYAQLINNTGITEWDNNGTIVCNNDSNQQSIQVISDQNQGCIIVWEDMRNINSDIFAQKLNQMGDAQWELNGTVICNDSNSQVSPKLCIDNSQGAIITWLDNRTAGNHNDIYGQNINSTGGVSWTLNGTGICTHSSNQINHQIINRSDGAILVWADNRTLPYGYGIYCQFLGFSGNLKLEQNGRLISDLNNDQNYPKLCSDSDDGAIIVWEDARSSIDIFAQRIYNNGRVGSREKIIKIPYYVNPQAAMSTIILIMLVFGLPLCTAFIYCLSQMRTKEKEEKIKPKEKREKKQEKRKHPRRLD
ncbi:MAG: hypothetical protein HWN67_00440 [Candidatus Helarchaeota archaeon]|nr:hypothetical protein [Candidatus Helarchaeota archaeon]